MKFTPVKTPEVAKRLFPKYIWDIKTDEKILYLSFDDGPTPGVTEFVLDTLNQYKAKATFFVLVITLTSILKFIIEFSTKATL